MLDESQDIAPLDLLAAARTPQLRSLLMESQSDRIMRKIAFSLFQRMRHTVQLLSCVNGVISHDAALSALPNVMLAGMADLTPLHGRILIVIEGDLIGAVVDGMCGATTGDFFERHELSTMETRIGKQMIDLTLASISEVLSNLMPMKWSIVQYETATGMLAIADGQDWMISTTGIFETALGIGSIKVIAPYASFEPLEARINSQAGLLGPHAADARWASTLEKLTEVTPVELRVEIARAHVSIGVFQALSPGQILPCLLLADAIGLANGVDLFRADFGQIDGYVCCRPKAASAPDDTGSTDQQDPSGQVSDNDPVNLHRLQTVPRTTPTIAGGDVVARVPVLLTVELGRTHISVRELRQLRHGQVIVLDQVVDEPLDILANGRRVAIGEVVAIAQDRYGIRVTALVEARALAA